MSVGGRGQGRSAREQPHPSRPGPEEAGGAQGAGQTLVRFKGGQREGEHGLHHGEHEEEEEERAEQQPPLLTTADA